MPVLVDVKDKARHAAEMAGIASEALIRAKQAAADARLAARGVQSPLEEAREARDEAKAAAEGRTLVL